MKDKNPFGYIDNNFINLYSDDNPLLNVGDKTFFLFNNLIDVHIQMIGYGEIVYEKFTHGMDKSYYIKILKIHSNKSTINDYFHYKPLMLSNENFNSQKIHKISQTNYKNKIFKVNCFFIRPNLDSINILRKQYMLKMAEILNQQVIEIQKLM